jgi:hypothetical protein
MKTPRVLFICKRRYSYGEYGGYGASYGLLNSCRFLVNSLELMGVESKVIEVLDNNDIDREVVSYKPTHVFIEAIWVVPSKFDVLIKLHPTVQWNVRIHSNTPFLSLEGVAIEWIKKYAHLQDKYWQFNIAPNSKNLCNDLLKSMGISTIYAPNIYQPLVKPELSSKLSDKNIINIGCFGATRPLKNQLIQAMAAIAFAKEVDIKMNFHINHSNVEMAGDNIYRNIVSLFEGTKYTLVEHDWMNHDIFLKVVKEMDLGLQVSLSETFNIVAADFVYLNIPIVGSNEIEWMNPLYQADPTNLDDIVKHLQIAWAGRKTDTQSLNTKGLNNYNKDAEKVWADYFKIKTNS